MRKGAEKRRKFAACAMLLFAVLALTFGRCFHEALHGAAEHAATAFCAGTVGPETHWHSAAAVSPGHLPGVDDALCPLCSGALDSIPAEARGFSVGAAERAKYLPSACRPAPVDLARSCRARAPPVC